MTDQYANLASGLESPAGGAFQVVPDDIVALPKVTRALYVGAGGNLAVEMVWGGTVVFADVPTGTILPLRVARVMASSTTAADIVGIY